MVFKSSTKLFFFNGDCRKKGTHTDHRITLLCLTSTGGSLESSSPTWHDSGLSGSFLDKGLPGMLTEETSLTQTTESRLQDVQISFSLILFNRYRDICTMEWFVKCQCCHISRPQQPCGGREASTCPYTETPGTYFLRTWWSVWQPPAPLSFFLFKRNRTRDLLIGRQVVCH